MKRSRPWSPAVPLLQTNDTEAYVPRPDVRGLQDPFIQRLVLICGGFGGGMLLLGAFFPWHLSLVSQSGYPSVFLPQRVSLPPERHLPPPALALSLAPTAPTGVAASPVEILEVPDSRQAQAHDPIRLGAPMNPDRSQHFGMAEWTSAASPKLVEAIPPSMPLVSPTVRTMDPKIPPAHLVVEPNTYYSGQATEPESVVLAESLSVHVDPRADAPEVSPALIYLQRVRPVERIRSETDFDWVRIPPTPSHPSGGWVLAEYLAPVASMAEPPPAGQSFLLGQEPVDRDRALPPDYRPHDLVPLAPQWTHLRKEILLRETTARAVEALLTKAQAQGLQLRVISGFRPYSHQRRLYFEALAQVGPKQNGTAMPGHSEHQLGTTVDFVGPDIRTHLNGRFGLTPEGRFLRDHAEEFGFRNSYTTENSEESGYKPEPWHWRHVSEANQP